MGPGNGHLLKDARSCSEIVQFGNGKPNILRPHPPIVGHDLHQPLGMGKGKRTQQNRIHDAENRRIRAYAQSQRKHRYDRKTRTLPKQPQVPLLFLGGRRQHTVQAQIHCSFGIVVGPSTCEDHAGPRTGTLAPGEDFRGLG